MKMRSTLAALVVAGLSFGASAATFEAQQPYQIYLVDGEKTANSITKSIHKVEIGEGKHQFAVAYTKDFSNRSEVRLLNGDPVIITLEVPADAQLSLDYSPPINYQLTRQFLREQETQLRVVDKASGRVMEADIFTIPTPAGLDTGRGIQSYLQEQGKAFNGRTEAAVAAAQAKFGEAAVDADALDMLKHWWNAADKDTRRAFQIWLIQQQ
ncbi:YccT family protein [Zobellella sp. An-6]|uniref:YccT family protein n=1 Tax=Zobellella sp. An-6 TaxID=3400218 RepID=UPI0040412971